MNKHEYLCQLCDAIAAKSSCEKKKVGALFVDEDGIIISTGFNEAPKGMQHCQGENFCCDAAGKCRRTVHAEMNAISNAARNGVCLKDKILYISKAPCEECSKLLVNIGTKKICAKEGEKNELLVFAKMPMEKWFT